MTCVLDNYTLGRRPVTGKAKRGNMEFELSEYQELLRATTRSSWKPSAQSPPCDRRQRIRPASTLGTGRLSRQALSLGGCSTEMERKLISERVLGMPREHAADRDVAYRDIPHARQT